MIGSMHGRLVRTRAWVLVVSPLLLLTSADALLAQAVTYARDVAPIVQENCVRCHRPGTAAPMVLQTYEQVRQWAPLIKEQVESRAMPPGWYLDRTVGIQAFKNDPSLSERQIETIVGWVEAGAPLGDPEELPPPIDWPADHAYWEMEELTGLGPPDLIVESEPYTVPANGQDQWFLPETDLPITEPRWIRAVETRPADVNSGYVFHHANTNLVRADESSDYVDADDAAGGLSSAAVGKRADVYPEDSGKLILPGDRLRWRLHLFPIGEVVENARIQVGIWFYPKGQRPKYPTRDEITFQTGHKSGELGVVRYTDYLIPPNGYQMVQAVHVLERNARIHSVRGHMHLRGGWQMAEAVYSDGRREVLNKIDWNHKWHTSHIYEDWAQPLLPKGTIIIATSLFDNTANNPSNPDPDQWVTFNKRSAGEMGHIRLGITWLEDEDFERLVREREELLAERRMAQRSGG